LAGMMGANPTFLIIGGIFLAFAMMVFIYFIFAIVSSIKSK